MNKTSKILAVLLAISVIALIILGVKYNKLFWLSIKSGEQSVKETQAINEAGYELRHDGPGDKLELKKIEK